MSRDINSEQYFQNSTSLRHLKRYSPNRRAFFPGSPWRSIPHNALDTNKTLNILHQVEQLLEELPEMVQQLDSCEPLCTCADQRQLARQALAALKKRQNEDFRNLANRLADDIAGAVD